MIRTTYKVCPESNETDSKKIRLRICLHTHLIFFIITSLSINTPLPAVLPRTIARLEVLNWDLFQSIHHGSLHVFNSPKMVSFQAGFELGKQKEIRRGQVWAVGRLGQRCHGLFHQKLSH